MFIAELSKLKKDQREGKRGDLETKLEMNESGLPYLKEMRNDHVFPSK